MNIYESNQIDNDETVGDIKRKNDVFSFLNKMDEYDTSTKIIKKILSIFPELKGYRFLRSEEIYTGLLLRTVDLKIEKISIPAVVKGVKSNKTGGVVNITLYNNYKDSLWKIVPSKYYLFGLEQGDKKLFRSLLSGYTEKNFKI